MQTRTTKRKGTPIAFEPKPLKVLLADNDAKTRDELSRALRSHGDFQVIAVVGHDRKAIDQATRLGPHVVVAGLGIPAMSGIQLMRAIVEARPDTGVLAVSKHDSATIIKQAFGAGARGLLLMQSVASELRKAVRAVAHGKRYLGAGVVDQVFDSIQADRPNPTALKGLTELEREIMRMVADGKSNAETAGILRLSPRTVETYRARLMRKLGLANVPSLVKFAIRHGVTELD